MEGAIKLENIDFLSEKAIQGLKLSIISEQTKSGSKFHKRD